MSAAKTQWTIVLRCYSCSRKFTVRHLFRRPRNGDTWHFNPDCSKWPVDDYVELEAAPNTGELCNECQVTPS